MKLTDELGRLQIKGEEWSFGFGDAGTKRGKLCRGACSYKTCRIIIRRKGRNATILNTLAHEMAHAFFPNASEKEVEDFGNSFEQAYNWFSQYEYPPR